MKNIWDELNRMLNEPYEPKEVGWGMSLENKEKLDNAIKEQFSKHASYIDTEPFVIENPYAKLKEIDNRKQFICKGKHQYREIEGNWICQCGRKL